MQIEEQLNKVKAKLESVSKSFCIAKWTQVSIHLQNGTTHSCHHPPTHKIPAKLLTDQPSALHNTPQKLQEREEMLKGQRPSGCDYCWRVEDAPGNNISDRIFKSSFPWSYPHLDRILSDPLNPHFQPTYVEVNLGDVCNFKCSYCGPEVSTRWMAEIKEHGSYPTSTPHPHLKTETMPIPLDQENPYREAFWKWWPDLYPSLETFRVTGGEPLLNKDFFQIMEWIKHNPKPNLTFAVNTNLCPPENKWNQFLTDLKEISKEGQLKEVQVYTSAEAWGKKAEYIRFGMDFELWRNRLWELLETIPSVYVTIMATYNALSTSSFEHLLGEVLKIKSEERFYNHRRNVPIVIDISYLRYPQHQSIQILTPDFIKEIEKHAAYMKENPEFYIKSENRYQRGFLAFETQKMERIKNWFQAENDKPDAEATRTKNRGDFYAFFSEHDRRRKTDFLETFPEFKDFWELCKRSNSPASSNLPRKLWDALRKPPY